MKRAIKIAVALLAPCLLALSLCAGGPEPRMNPNAGVRTNAVIVWPAPLRLYDIYVNNPTATNEWVMVFVNYPAATNTTWVATNTPAATNGTIPSMAPWPVAAGGFVDKDFSYYGITLDNCYIGISSTSNTFTSAVTNAFFIQAIFDHTTQ
jgi:hypothetical protein